MNNPFQDTVKVQSIIKSIPIGRDHEFNLWGDYDQVVQVSIRPFSKPEEIGILNHATAYFLVGPRAQTKTITFEQFNELCISIALSQAKVIST